MVWTAPRTWVAGEKPTASTLNQHIRDNFKAIGDAWTSYAPSTTNVTLGNGTLTGAWSQAGKDTNFRIKLVFGSTTALTGSPTFTLPAAATASRTVVPRAALWDDSAGSQQKGAFALNTSTTVLQLRDDASAALSATVPFTWTTSDEIIIVGSYEAA